MRKVIIFNMVTLDGFFEGATKWDIAWHRTDEEFNEYAIKQLNEAGGLIFGRVTYEGMASYWQSPAALEDDITVAHMMNELPKYVFSKTLLQPDWKNTRLINGIAKDELVKMKQQPGKDLFIFGSADLASTFIKDKLIDEYRLIVAPIVLGKGTPLFKPDQEPYNLKLINSRVFLNGNVLLSYTNDVESETGENK